MTLQFDKEYGILSIRRKDYGQSNQKQFGESGDTLSLWSVHRVFSGSVSSPFYDRQVSFFRVGRSKTDEPSDIKKSETWGKHRPSDKVTEYTKPKGLRTAFGVYENTFLLKANSLFLFKINKFLSLDMFGNTESSQGVRVLSN